MRRDRSRGEGKKQMSEYRLGNVYVAGILYPRDIRRTRAESVRRRFCVARIIAPFKQDPRTGALSAGINVRAELHKEVTSCNDNRGVF